MDVAMEQIEMREDESQLPLKGADVDNGDANQGSGTTTCTYVTGKQPVRP